MLRLGTLLGVSLLLLASPTARLHARNQELKTVESATAVIHALADIPLKGIPHALMHEAAGVAIFPHVLKAGLVVDERFGHGVILVHEPDGRWSNPVFVSLEGVGVGGQAGIESTELVLVFKTRKSLERALHGKLTLGGDISIAAGPLGREAEAATDRWLKAEIYSYSRSRGLFAGVSLEGAGLRVDARANERFYGLKGGRPEDVLAHREISIAAVKGLLAQVARLSEPPHREHERRP
jgi:lipid-binding SYLF domain-containing protein